MKIKALLIFFVALAGGLPGTSRSLIEGPYQILLGPEIFHTTRKVNRLGTQSGILAGGHIHLERMRPSSLYLAVDGMGATGLLSGHERNHHPCCLQSTEFEIEGRSGFSMCTRLFPYFLFTPYFGYGKFWGISHFLSPSNNERIKLRNEFRFFSFGTNFRFYLGNHLTFDCDFRAKTIFDARRKVRGTVSIPHLAIGEEFQYEADFPFTYHQRLSCKRFFFSIAPFWRQRHYGTYASQVTIENRERMIVVEDTLFHETGVRFLLGGEF